MALGRLINMGHKATCDILDILLSSIGSH